MAAGISESSCPFSTGHQTMNMEPCQELATSSISKYTYSGPADRLKFPHNKNFAAVNINFRSSVTSEKFSDLSANATYFHRFPA